MVCTLIQTARRLQLWGNGYVSPFQQFIFSVNFRAAQSLTATLCGCLFKRICILRQQLQYIVQSRLHEPCSVYYFASNALKKFHVVLCLLAPDPGDATAKLHCKRLAMNARRASVTSGNRISSSSVVDSRLDRLLISWSQRGVKQQTKVT